MRICFVRHGERHDDADPSDPPLTEAGQNMARFAGRWLAQFGVAPTLILRTRTLRTAETTQALISGWEEFTKGSCAAPVVTREGLPTSPDRFAKLTNDLHSTHGAGDWVWVGHHPTQDFFERLPGAREAVSARGNFGAIYVAEVVASDWRVTAGWRGGTPPITG